MQSLPSLIGHRMSSVWSNNKHYVIKKLECEATSFTQLEEATGESIRRNRISFPPAVISWHQVDSRNRDKVSSTQYRLQAAKDIQEHRATVEEKLQLWTSMEDPRVEDEPHHDCRRWNRQMKPRITVCVYHNRTKGQNVLFSPTSSRQNYKGSGSQA